MWFSDTASTWQTGGNTLLGSFVSRKFNCGPLLISKNKTCYEWSELFNQNKRWQLCPEVFHLFSANVVFVNFYSYSEQTTYVIYITTLQDRKKLQIKSGSYCSHNQYTTGAVLPHSEHWSFLSTTTILPSRKQIKPYHSHTTNSSISQRHVLRTTSLVNTFCACAPQAFALFLKRKQDYFVPVTSF